MVETCLSLMESFRMRYSRIEDVCLGVCQLLLLSVNIHLCWIYSVMEKIDWFERRNPLRMEERNDIVAL
jgi:hypothetical protein